MTTLKLQCVSKTDWGADDERQTSLSFMPDYLNGANKEWAKATPSADLRIVVKGSIGDEFVVGQKVDVAITFNRPEGTPSE